MTPDLAPQVPGQLPGVDPDSLAPLLDMAPAELALGVSSLTALELAALDALERSGEARATYLDVISTEQMRRLEDSLPPDPSHDGVIVPEIVKESPIGDQSSYARKAAQDIDPSSISRPVLSKDGWVLPLPAAKAE